MYEGIIIDSEAVDSDLSDIKLEDGAVHGHVDEDVTSANGQLEEGSTTNDVNASRSPSSQLSLLPTKTEEDTASLIPNSVDEHEEDLGGEITVKLENGKAPKLSRKSSQKIMSRPAPLFDHLPDATPEAVTKFQVIRDCIYGSKYMGSSEHDALGCDCSEEWSNGKNYACGEDSDCINRATKMECLNAECNCGAGCQNQRFQQKQYANVSVIKTEKKGYGLRTDSDLQANDFIFEYVGEVINEPTFRRRTIQYDDEGIKHFYFMSLTKSEFVDATKKGNLGRFCNHSCNPNCYVDKWVVGDKLRMGIFAERNIKSGEELVFNYNVDRYGADPQPCYCGEPNCTGFIGGKTQTERATKLSHATIEALGIDDGDGWDTAVAKRPRKKKAGEDDEEYVSNLQPKGLDEDGVTKVMATLMQCKEKWIAVKLLSRLQRCDDDRVRNRVVRMHGYQILRTTLTAWQDDNNVILQVLDILYKFPRLTRNKIVDSKIEAALEPLKISEHEDVAFEANRLLEEWSKLEVAYRIPRKKFDPNAQPVFERRESTKEEVVKSPAPATTAPTGPRSNVPQRSANKFLPGQRPAISRRGFSALPPGWFTAMDQNGNTYYYSKSGQTTWQRPQFPAPEPPPPPKVPPKAVANQKALQDIIDSLTKVDQNPPTPTSVILPPVEASVKDKKAEKWRSMPQEKQMKVYENTLFPHIKYVMDKFRNKLPKEDLKKFAKEIGKKLVASDYKNNRVEDPTKISPKHEKKVKKYVKDFFDKAVAKKAEHDKRRAEKRAALKAGTNGTKELEPSHAEAEPDLPDDEILAKAVEFEVEISDDESPAQLVGSVPATPGEESLKRKRDDLNDSLTSTPADTPYKRIKDEDSAEPSPPPPPPPPPGEDMGEALLNDQMDMDLEAQLAEDMELAEQEAALMRENEEALIKENEEAMKEAEAMKLEPNAPLSGSIDEVDDNVKSDERDPVKQEQLESTPAYTNGTTMVESIAVAEDDDAAASKDQSGEDLMEVLHHERKQVLSH